MSAKPKKSASERAAIKAARLSALPASKKPELKIMQAEMHTILWWFEIFNGTRKHPTLNNRWHPIGWSKDVYDRALARGLREKTRYPLNEIDLYCDPNPRLDKILSDARKARQSRPRSAYEVG